MITRNCKNLRFIIKNVIVIPIMLWKIYWILRNFLKLALTLCLFHLVCNFGWIISSLLSKSCRLRLSLWLGPITCSDLSKEKSETITGAKKKIEKESFTIIIQSIKSCNRKMGRKIKKRFGYRSPQNWITIKKSKVKTIKKTRTFNWNS